MRSSSRRPHVAGAVRGTSPPWRRRSSSDATPASDWRCRSDRSRVGSALTVNGTHGLAGREPLQFRDGHLDHEPAAGLEMRRDVAEAVDLLVLCHQIGDRVVDEVGEGEHSGRPWRWRSRRWSPRSCRLPASARICSTIGRRTTRSRATSTPRSLSGSATRPVPMPSSRAAPFPTCSARKATVGSSTPGSNMSAEVASYRLAIRSSKTILVMGHSRQQIRHRPQPISSRSGAERCLHLGGDQRAVGGGARLGADGRDHACPWPSCRWRRRRPRHRSRPR